MDRWVEVNRRLWDASAPGHVTSEFYDVESFRAGRSSLDRLVLDAVGAVEGRSLLHLQCHFGMDTISWARLGARVTGVDFSPEAITAARRLADDAGVEATFVESDVLGLDLGRTFDVVFASWGVLVWIPDIHGWMATAARHVRPGGRLVLVEQHPVLWAWDASADAFVPNEPYFARGPSEVHVDRTYAGTPVDLPAVQFNHGLGEVVTAAVGAGLAIERLTEHPLVEWRALPWMEEDDDGMWRLPGDPLPLSYTLVASRP